jgi:hypothetical protein
VKALALFKDIEANWVSKATITTKKEKIKKVIS